MDNREKLVILKARLHKVISRGKTEEFPGVRRKLERQIQNLETKI